MDAHEATACIRERRLTAKATKREEDELAGAQVAAITAAVKTQLKTIWLTSKARELGYSVLRVGVRVG